MRIPNPDARLHLLPPELIIMIWEELVAARDLSDDDDQNYRRNQKALWAFSLVCRTLNSCVQSRGLYRVYCTWNEASVAPFLRTLCEHPYLAKNVKRIKMWNPGSASMLVPPDSNSLHLLRAAMKPFREWDLYEELLQALYMGCDTANLVLILLMATNVEQLLLDPFAPQPCACSQIAHYLVSFLKWSCDASRSIYSHLWLLQIKRHWASSIWNSDDALHHLVIEFMRLPTLYQLSVDELNPPGFNANGLLSNNWNPVYPPSIAYSALSNVSDLTLCGSWNSQPYPYDPTYLLYICAPLKMFEIIWYESIYHLNGVLLRHAGSLEQLTVKGCNPHAPHFRIRDLHDFKQLWLLHISAHMLGGIGEHFPTLPISLRYLNIHLEGGLEDLARLLLRFYKDLNSNLEFLIVNCNARHPANDKYLDLIQEAYTGDGNVSPKDGFDWIIFLSRKGPGMNFQCQRGALAIWDTIGAIKDQVIEGKTINISKGIVRLLKDYYRDWPPPDTNRQAVLQKIRRKARGGDGKEWESDSDSED